MGDIQLDRPAPTAAHQGMQKPVRCCARKTRQWLRPTGCSRWRPKQAGTEHAQHQSQRSSYKVAICAGVGEASTNAERPAKTAGDADIQPQKSRTEHIFPKTTQTWRMQISTKAAKNPSCCRETRSNRSKGWCCRAAVGRAETSPDFHGAPLQSWGKASDLHGANLANQ